VPGLTSAMLMRGTTKYDRVQLADAFDKLKMAGGLTHFQTTRENLPDALKLVAHVLKEPSFPAAEFEQLRQQSLVGLEASRSEPPAVASRALGEHFDMYPKGDIRHETTFEEDSPTSRTPPWTRSRPSTATSTAPCRPRWPSSAISTPKADRAAGRPAVRPVEAPMHVAPVLRKNGDIAPIHET
jgi:zinc protease